MDNVIAVLSSVGELSPRVIDYLYEHLQSQHYLKREYLLRQHRPCDHMWFIEKGLLGCFYEKSDKTLCGWFMQSGDIVTSVPAFYLRIPAEENIIALDDTTTYFLHYDQLQFMYKNFPEFNWNGRRLTEKYYVLTEQRMRAFHNQSPIDKYKFLLDNFPDLVLKVSNRNLARFLGITLETLSRIKTKVFRRNN